ncbi:cold-regulated protein 27 isoform X2 [Ricinus communis]|uniref:cold-regulated protein 27 isoform X2 n=1 Tax=Ricinus communis TaxID=3988 RepID=UPI00201A51D6|nr:cold-regulated protein 27 isoform X2 [Ricinus communis]
MNGCRSETRTSSSSGESSAESAQQELQMTEPISTEWTDEKHRLYLKSMEASFVKQLYNSMDDLDLQLKKEMSDPNLSKQVHSNKSTPSGQFKILRGGCWEKINFQRPASQVNIANEPSGVLISPWIRHFRSARKPQDIVQERIALQNQAINSSGKKVVSGCTATCFKRSYPRRFYSCRNGPVDSNTEVSDQNFVDENIRSGKKTSACSSERMKKPKTGAAINDQIDNEDCWR